MCTYIDIKTDEFRCKLRDYIYLLMCTHFGIQYVDESVTSLNLRMNIHRRGKLGCETSVYHYRNRCKNTTFSIQVIEKLPGNVYENAGFKLT